VLAALILLLLPLDPPPPNLGSQPTLSPDTGMNPTGTIPSTPPSSPALSGSIAARRMFWKDCWLWRRNIRR
jgi:hypothetical protein